MVKKLIICLCLLMISACGLENFQNSDLPDTRRLDAIRVGDTKEKVLRVLGTPNYQSDPKEGIGDVIFYAQAKKSSRIFFDPEVTERVIHVYTFDTKGVLTDKKLLTLADGNKVTYDTDITKVGGKELSVLEQLAENFGRYNAGGQDSTVRH
ncbi:MAG: outer membrane protein assembly factor BamE [Alphaproteobacteria bacterium]|nr:outer membrane protein assembly factor BamE [Alphaproteobacteria bacterium]